MQKIVTALIFSMALIAVTAAALIAGGWGPNREQARRHAEELHQIELQVMQERAYQAIIRERRLAPVKTVAGGIGILGGVGMLLYAGYYVVQNLRKRSLLVYPDKSGLFPLIKVRTMSGTEVVHDPNRQPSGSVVYTEDGRGNVVVMPIVAPGLETAAEAATRQAAAIQLVRASVSGGARLTEDAERVARRFLPAEDTTSYGDLAPLGTLHAELAAAKKYLEVDDAQNTS